MLTCDKCKVKYSEGDDGWCGLCPGCADKAFLGLKKTKRIPIKAAREFARKHKLTHVVVFGYDGKDQHVVTYGASVEQCGQAADFGNMLKSLLNWPKALQAQPSRVRMLQARIKELEVRLKEWEP